MRKTAAVQRREAKPFGEAAAVLLEGGCPHLGVLGNQGIRVPEESEKGSPHAAEFRQLLTESPVRLTQRSSASC
ncbi:hypothetical protein [Paenibacillus herberti]|uniref:Uncharacterized protein n=1 Tax=Paenibacillus herberti TaxID=1619309 RepID=A0A229NUZ6_9BACL|nr:hypothetical protein [Paenibacillus herberti]OXM13654.1 hypothetical protein CGZ75_21780 [Paenibacillus herberti]